jgi:hypothetical protein
LSFPAALYVIRASPFASTLSEMPCASRSMRVEALAVDAPTERAATRASASRKGRRLLI